MHCSCTLSQITEWGATSILSITTAEHKRPKLHTAFVYGCKAQADSGNNTQFQQAGKHIPQPSTCTAGHVTAAPHKQAHLDGQVVGEGVTYKG